MQLQNIMPTSNETKLLNTLCKFLATIDCGNTENPIIPLEHIKQKLIKYAKKFKLIEIRNTMNLTKFGDYVLDVLSHNSPNKEILSQILLQAINENTLPILLILSKQDYSANDYQYGTNVNSTEIFDNFNLGWQQAQTLLQKSQRLQFGVCVNYQDLQHYSFNKQYIDNPHKALSLWFEKLNLFKNE